MLVVRPEAIEMIQPDAGKYIGVVRYAIYLGANATYQIEIAGNILIVDVSNQQPGSILSPGTAVGVNFQEETIHMLGGK